MIEKKLREAPLVAPSATLDNKIRGLIDNSVYSRKHLFNLPIPLWASTVACLIFALFGFFLSQWTGNEQSQPDPEQVLIYVMEPDEALRDLLIRGKSTTGQNFFQTEKPDIYTVTPKTISLDSQSF